MKQVFEIVPPGGSGFVIVFCIIVVVSLGVAGLFGYIAWSARHVTVEISSEGLAIKGGMYGRRIPLSDLVLDQARLADLETDTGLRLAWRTNGIGMPGYSAGWFRTRNSGKVLAFVTDRRRVVYVPTRGNYSLMLSVESPEALVSALRAAGR